MSLQYSQFRGLQDYLDHNADNPSYLRYYNTGNLPDLEYYNTDNPHDLRYYNACKWLDPFKYQECWGS
jgi:hypothetical protein